jgi:hypothetical protein
MNTHSLFVTGLLCLGLSTARAEGEDAGHDGAAQLIPFSQVERGTRSAEPRGEVKDVRSHFSEALGLLDKRMDDPEFLQRVLRSFRGYDPATAIRDSVSPHAGDAGLSDEERVRLYEGFVSVVEAAEHSSDPHGLVQATQEVLDGPEGPDLLERQARGEDSLLAAAQDRLDPSYADLRQHYQLYADHNLEVLEPLLSLPPEELPVALEQARDHFSGDDYEVLKDQVVGPGGISADEFEGAMEQTDRVLSQMAGSEDPARHLRTLLETYQDPDFAATAAAWARRAPPAELDDSIQSAAKGG